MDNSTNALIAEAMEAEQNLKKKIEELLDSVCASVLSAMEKAGTMDGVKPLGDGCYSVSFATLEKHSNMTAEFYSPDSQMKLVKRTLEKANTLTGVAQKLREMVVKGSVRVDNTTYRLNPLTISVLEGFCVPPKSE